MGARARKAADRGFSSGRFVTIYAKQRIAVPKRLFWKMDSPSARFNRKQQVLRDGKYRSRTSQEREYIFFLSAFFVFEALNNKYKINLFLIMYPLISFDDRLLRIKYSWGDPAGSGKYWYPLTIARHLTSSDVSKRNRIYFRFPLSKAAVEFKFGSSLGLCSSVRSSWSGNVCRLWSWIRSYFYVAIFARLYSGAGRAVDPISHLNVRRQLITLPLSCTRVESRSCENFEIAITITRFYFWPPNSNRQIVRVYIKK